MPTKKRNLRKSRKRKLRKSRGGGTSRWDRKNWITQEVDSEKNREECRANALKSNPEHHLRIDSRLKTLDERNSELSSDVMFVHNDKNKTYPQNLADFACGDEKDKMVWSNYGFFYDDLDKGKRLQQHAISQKYREAMKTKYEEKYS
jgi:hypothetical protein